MNKKLLTLGVVALATAGLVACDSNRNTNGREKVLTYLVSSESTAYTNILNQLIKEFNASIKEEGYRIETETPGGDYYGSLGTKFTGSSVPDIMMMEIGYFNAYARFLEPLDTYIEKSSVLSKSDLWDINDAYTYQGTTRALIKDFSPDFMLIYNKTMLNSYNASHPEKQFIISETDPMTWSEFYEMTSTIQKEQNVTYGTSLGFEPVKHLHELVQMTGATMYTNNNTELNVNNEHLREAFSFYCALQKDNATEFSYFSKNQNNGKAPASYTSGSNTSEQELFKQGRTFSIFNGLYSFAAYDFYNLNFEVGIAPSPVEKKGDKAYSTTSAMVSHAIAKSSKHKDIAWRWLEFYQTEGLKRLAKIAFNIPGNKTIASSDAFLKNDNEKVSKMTQYFYNYVASGAVHATVYNPNISFQRIQTCFSTHFAKYYDGQLDFNSTLNEINKSIKASI